VFFEAPRRTAAALAAMAEVFGADRPAAVCRELTKTHEEVRRGTLDELASWAEAGLLGEVTLVVAGADPSAASPPSDADLVAEVAALEADGMSRRDAIAQVARTTGARRRDVYDAVHRG
jgi:16S rRNA (cytidine1402-2'-O)-methyltransferase